MSSSRERADKLPSSCLRACTVPALTRNYLTGPLGLFLCLWSPISLSVYFRFPLPCNGRDQTCQLKALSAFYFHVKTYPLCQKIRHSTIIFCSHRPFVHLGIYTGQQTTPRAVLGKILLADGGTGPFPSAQR